MINLSKFKDLPENEQRAVFEITKSIKGFRKEQRIPFADNWNICCVSSGRGWGKSYVASTWLAARMLAYPNLKCVIIGRTLDDVKKININSPETGIFRFLPFADSKQYHNKSEHVITLDNGSSLTYYGAKDCDKLRGTNNSIAVFDEFSSADSGVKLWNDLQMTMRVKRDDISPQTLAISTPKRNEVTESVHKSADVFIRGSTYDNKDNLSEAFIEQLKKEFAGTSLEKLELYGEMEDIAGALADPKTIEKYREDIPDSLDSLVISIDPATEAGSDGSETGIVVVGRRGADLYVQSDLSTRDEVAKWANLVVDVANNRNAKILMETNAHGQFGEYAIASAAKQLGLPTPTFKVVKALSGKVERAEAASQALAQGRLHFPMRGLATLESQFCGMSRDPIYHDKKAMNDRVDALAHAVMFYKPKSSLAAL